LSRAEADGNLAQSRLESLELTVARHEEEAMEARIQLQAATKAVEELGDLDTARRETEDIKTTVEASRMTMMTKRSACDELRREGEARLKRMSEIEKEMNIWRHRLQTAEQRSAELLQRQSETEETLKEANLKPDEIAQKRTKIDASVVAAQTRCKEAGDALALGETTQRESVQRERDAERAASEAREERAVSQARADAARDQQAKAASRIEEDLGQTPQLLLAKLNRDADKMPPAGDVEAEVGRLKRQRDALGAVNLRAEEDAKEVEAEYTSLASEKADLEEAVKALRNGISNLNREGRERLLTAFEQVNSNFGMLFKHLFGGGEADLVMVESDDPLEAGLEIMCQPPGKKLSTMSLLSGGEQTLTALALIFAVFLANPAPICVLDEVDAPLDDANVTRFCDMLDEMCRRTDTRFLIITHHAVTMARMDRLFGVTMQEQGVSQLVSVDLKRAETMVA
ncbi:MAG: chromosome segregation protein SMC, partial [Rhodobacteraceae bacterium]|nr:chromosome segregation protein SMC [Paracoccaceae bacterium]NDH27276.1 chromosome segregation protein SMC [Paracoccaceae bacterium]